MSTLTRGGRDVLAEILGATRGTVADRRARESLAALERRALQVVPRGWKFLSAVGRHDRVNVIAECKRRSPSRGLLSHDYDPAAIAREYERGGAAAISVVTEPAFFGGSLADLRSARSATQLPVLRKDFVVDEYQLFEARAAGADAVLLIVAALPARELARLHASARQLGLAALVEVHDELELGRALEIGAEIVGVNNRNLRTLSVDVDASLRLAAMIPPGVVAVSESGLTRAADIRRLSAAGYHAFLVGERLMTDRQPARAVADLTARAPVLKICGITRPADAARAAQEGATAIGFVFWEGSPRHVTPEAAAEIISRIPPRVTPVGVFVNESPERIRAVADAAGVRAIQLHGDEPPAYIDAIEQPVFRSVTLDSSDRDWPASATLLLDAADPARRGGTGRVVDWAKAAEVARRRSTILAGGLSPDNVADAIALTRPYGVDVSSGVESAPGIKDPAKLATFLSNARAAFGAL